MLYLKQYSWNTTKVDVTRQSINQHLPIRTLYTLEAVF